MKLSPSELRRLADMPPEALPEVLRLLADRAQVEDDAEHKEADRRARNAHRMRTKRAQRAAQAEHPPSSLLSPTPPINSPPPSSKVKTNAHARGERLPDGFLPSEEEAQKMREELGVGTAWLIGETRKFRDYWRAVSGEKAVKRDWPATWRNWMRTAAERKGPGPPRGGGAMDTVRELLQEIEGRDGDASFNFDEKPGGG